MTISLSYFNVNNTETKVGLDVSDYQCGLSMTVHIVSTSTGWRVDSFDVPEGNIKVAVIDDVMGSIKNWVHNMCFAVIDIEEHKKVFKGSLKEAVAVTTALNKVDSKYFIHVYARTCARK